MKRDPSDPEAQLDVLDVLCEKLSGARAVGDHVKIREIEVKIQEIEAEVMAAPALVKRLRGLLDAWRAERAVAEQGEAVLPVPRYDEVFVQGSAWLDSLAKGDDGPITDLLDEKCLKMTTYQTYRELEMGLIDFRRFFHEKILFWRPMKKMIAAWETIVARYLDAWRLLSPSEQVKTLLDLLDRLADQDREIDHLKNEINRLKNEQGWP